MYLRPLLVLIGSIGMVLFSVAAQPVTPECTWLDYPNTFQCSIPQPTPTPTVLPLTAVPVTPQPTVIPTPIPTLVPASPVAGLPCPGWMHDRIKITGPDGKQYATWHPAVDPASGCLYGHEHGADPATSQINNTPPAFGYAAAVAGMTEPHEGYKVFVLNAGMTVESNVDNKLADDDARLVFHMGTSSTGRYLQPQHGFEFDYAARDGSGRETHLQGLADTGPTNMNGSTCDNPRQGAKDFSTVGCADTYEIWPARFQVMWPGEFMGINESRVGLLLSLAVFDPITTRDPMDNTMLVYTENVKPGNNSEVFSGLDPLSTDAYYQGCRREFYSGPLYFNNDGQPTEYYTDAFGNVSVNGKDDTHPLRQYIAATAANKAAVYKLRTDYCGNGIHRPN